MTLLDHHLYWPKL